MNANQSFLNFFFNNAKSDLNLEFRMPSLGSCTQRDNLLILITVFLCPLPMHTKKSSTLFRSEIKRSLTEKTKLINDVDECFPVDNSPETTTV